MKMTKDIFCHLVPYWNPLQYSPEHFKSMGDKKEKSCAFKYRDFASTFSTLSKTLILMSSSVYAAFTATLATHPSFWTLCFLFSKRDCSFYFHSDSACKVTHFCSSMFSKPMESFRTMLSDGPLNNALHLPKNNSTI